MIIAIRLVQETKKSAGCGNYKGDEKCRQEKEKQNKSDSGVSSGDSYCLSHQGSGKDRIQSSPSKTIDDAKDLGIGVFVIMRKPLDANLSDHQLRYRLFSTSNGFLVYVWNRYGYRHAPFLAPGVFERHIPYHEIVFRDEINLESMILNNQTYQQIIESKYPGVGTLIG